VAGIARERRILDALALCVAKAALSIGVLYAGFTHISDDDYARTVIAEQFAHAPRLDPSGTSWLPAPFWLEGLVMMLVGRSLGVARALAVTLGAASVAAPYLAMRAAGMARAPAVVASAIAMAMPYGLWLGAATVPEGWTGALTAAALLAMSNQGSQPAAACALLGTSLSRYESWPACAVFAIFCARRAARESSRRRAVTLALVAVAGPGLWMAWNAHAHGNPLHFVERVTRFRHAIGAADIPLVDKLLGYPRSLLADTPEAGILGAMGVIGMGLHAPLRARWRWPAMAVAVVVAFLVAGDVGDGAPTHHPARALSAVWWIFAAIGVDAAFAALAGLQRRAGQLDDPSVAPRAAHGGVVPATLRALGAAALASAWVLTVIVRAREPPGTSEAEHRELQIARGLDMRARAVASAAITPCAFEHFALVAAWGSPERATLNPRTGAAVTAACPGVEER
jgi:hypothetical protein